MSDISHTGTCRYLPLRARCQLRFPFHDFVHAWLHLFFFFGGGAFVFLVYVLTSAGSSEKQPWRCDFSADRENIYVLNLNWYYLLGFFFCHTHMPSSFWTSRGHRCRVVIGVVSFSPSLSLPSFFIAHIWFSKPTARRLFIE